MLVHTTVTKATIRERSKEEKDLFVIWKQTAEKFFSLFSEIQNNFLLIQYNNLILEYNKYQVIKILKIQNHLLKFS